ncbi:MAG TPA: TlpA disulfide reductase family protein [Bacteroidota bacterium]|nr:TlpA disulfide reductase family protein [Bacteroidota bacterium]
MSIGRLFVSLILLASPAVLRAQTPADTLPVVRRIAPADIAPILAGERGNVVLLNIWASWCKPCMEELPFLSALRNELAGKRFTLLLMSDDDGGAIDSLVRPALRKSGVSFPSYNLGGMDDERLINTVDSSWSGALPATFLYAAGGRLTLRLVGGRTKSEFLDAVRRLLP